MNDNTNYEHHFTAPLGMLCIYAANVCTFMLLRLVCFFLHTIVVHYLRASIDGMTVEIMTDKIAQRCEAIVRGRFPPLIAGAHVGPRNPVKLGTNELKIPVK